MLGKFTGEEETDCGLDFPTGDGGFLVVVGQFGGFGGNLLEDVVHERIHDAHGLTGDTNMQCHHESLGNCATAVNKQE